jgi:hypothetical protein
MGIRLMENMLMYCFSFDGLLLSLLSFNSRDCGVNTLLSVHLVYEEAKDHSCIIEAE